MVAPKPAVAQKQNANVQHTAYTCGIEPSAWMISEMGKVTANIANEVMSAERSTVFSHRREHASATPSNPSMGDRGVHHLSPMVKLRRSESVFARRSARVVYGRRVTLGVDETVAFPSNKGGNSSPTSRRYGTGASSFEEPPETRAVTLRNPTKPPNCAFRRAPSVSGRTDEEMRTSAARASLFLPARCRAAGRGTQPWRASVDIACVRVESIVNERFSCGGRFMGLVIKATNFTNPRTRATPGRHTPVNTHIYRQHPPASLLELAR